MPTLGEMARLIRSKNAGPFVITFDIMFPDTATFEKIRALGIINPKVMAQLYNLREDQVKLIEYPPGFAFKISIPRPVPCGDPLDADIFGAQLHGPLVDMEVPL
jgi:hypothetical protein